MALVGPHTFPSPVPRNAGSGVINASFVLVTKAPGDTLWESEWTSGDASKSMVYFPNPGARAIAISMSVVHQHAGSPYINGHANELQLARFPIGMVFIFVVFGLVGLAAILCAFMKLFEKRKERSSNIKSMPTLSMLRPPSPRRDLLRSSNLDYLSIATLPLFTYLFSRLKLKSQGRRSCDVGQNGVDPESEAARENMSSPLDYMEAVNLDSYHDHMAQQDEEFCEVDLGKGHMEYDYDYKADLGKGEGDYELDLGNGDYDFGNADFGGFGFGMNNVAENRTYGMAEMPASVHRTPALVRRADPPVAHTPPRTPRTPRTPRAAHVSDVHPPLPVRQYNNIHSTPPLCAKNKEGHIVARINAVESIV